MVRRQSEHVSFGKSDRSIIRVAHTRSVLRNRIQHRLNIRRRAGDDAQDFTRRGLLLQRFLELLEQPHVLDGNHRLIGEGLDEIDLPVRERLNIKSRHIKIVPVAAPSRRSGTAKTLRASGLATWTLIVRLVLDVVCSGVNALNRSTFQERATIQAFRNRPARCERRYCFGRFVVVGDKL